MAKGRTNGILKWIVAIVSLIGICFVVADRLLYLGKVDEIVRANVQADEKEHAHLDAISRTCEKDVIEIKGTIAQTQKDIAQVIKGQEAIQKDLHDLVMIHIIGPGSNGETNP